MIAQALQSLRPGAQWVLRGDTYEGLEWLDEVQTQPTEAEVNDEIAVLEAQAPLDACKAEAKQLIEKSDWAVLPDVGLANVSDFKGYRAILRQYILNPVADPVWPTEPTPVWE